MQYALGQMLLNEVPAGTDWCSACLQLEKEKFDMLIHSPLQRAKETAEIVWNAREGPVKVLPSLREIDLYSFQVPAMAHSVVAMLLPPC